MRDWPFDISLERKMMESMVTEPETIKREIDISNDIREVEENVHGSPFLALGKKLHGPLMKS